VVIWPSDAIGLLVNIEREYRTHWRRFQKYFSQQKRLVRENTRCDRPTLYSSCCSTDLRGHPRSM